MAKSKYRYVGTHADNVTIGDKVVPVGMGDFVDLEDADVKHMDNERLFDDVLLIDASTAATTTTSTTGGGDK